MTEFMGNLCVISDLAGVLQALGLTGLSNSYQPADTMVSNVMASQSLAALAQQGKCRALIQTYSKCDYTTEQ